MLTPAENELLTAVDAGTPAGEMLRRYWWPVHFSEQVNRAPVKVALLGEDLILFRDGDGRLGLLEMHCCHRRASLEFGRVEQRGIRCCYHGWLYDVAGRCLEQPAEPEDSTYKDRVRQPAYAAEEAGGLIFAYLGPQPAPLLPRYDLLWRDDGVRSLDAHVKYCNWLQAAENMVDQGHLVALHASVYPDMALKRPEVEWQVDGNRFRVATTIPGVSEPKVSWHLFPGTGRVTTARVGTTPSHDMFVHVPRTLSTATTFHVQFTPGDQTGLKTLGFRETQPQVFDAVDDAWWGIPSREQDRIAQESQGPVCDRTKEHLGSSDRGIVLQRKMMKDAIEAVEQGRDPVGVIRDPAENGIIELDARMEQIGVLA